MNLKKENIHICLDSEFEEKFSDMKRSFESVFSKTFYKENIEIKDGSGDEKLNVKIKFGEHEKEYSLSFFINTDSTNKAKSVDEKSNDQDGSDNHNSKKESPTYVFEFMSYPETIVDFNDDLNNFKLGKIEDDSNIKLLLKSLNKSKVYINSVDKKRWDRSFITARIYSEHIIYIGGKKYVEFSKNTKFLYSVLPKYVAIVMYLKFIEELLDEYYKIEPKNRLEHLNSVKDIYRPYGLSNMENENVNKIGLNGFTWFNNEVFKLYIEKFNIHNKLTTISEEANTRYQYEAAKTANILNNRIWMLTTITIIFTAIPHIIFIVDYIADIVCIIINWFVNLKQS